MLLAEYSFEIRHKPGKANVVADSLSRIKEQLVLMITRAQAAKLSTQKEDNEKTIKRKQELENHKKNARPMTKEEIEEVLNTTSSAKKINNRGKYIGGVRIIMDPQERLKLIEEAHNSLIGGHQGSFRTFKFLRESVNWPYMIKDIDKYIKKCKSCQINKHFRGTKVPLAVTSTSSRVFEKAHLDIVGPIPESESGNCFILTMQDSLSKYVLAVAIPNQETKTVAKALFDNVISIVGSPEIYLTDQGSNFMSKMFAELCKMLKIKKICTSAFRPQSNSQVERFHNTLGNYLRNFVQKNPANWDLFLSSAVFCYNCHEHRSLKRTPFEMLFGRKPNIPSCFKNKVDPVYTTDDYLMDLKFNLQQMHIEARKNILESKLASKARYDRNVAPLNLKEGDQVLIKDETRSGKLAPLRRGPYKVIRIISPWNTLVKIKNREKVIHNNRLLKFTADLVNEIQDDD